MSSTLLIRRSKHTTAWKEFIINTNRIVCIHSGIGKLQTLKKDVEQSNYFG